MTYDVAWTASADDMLTEVWLEAADRNAVSAVAHRVNHALACTPLAVGRPMDSSVHRAAYAPPLYIEFYVIEDDKKVVVQAVAVVSPRGSSGAAEPL